MEKKYILVKEPIDVRLNDFDLEANRRAYIILCLIL